MAQPIPRRQQVYRMCRALFSGNDARIRDKKPTKEMLLKDKDSLQPPVETVSEKRLVKAVQNLLDSRAFESDLRAKVLFLDRLRTSPQRDDEREASKAESARSVANIVEEITQYRTMSPTETNADGGSGSTTAPGSPHPVPNVPLIYPSHLPYGTQHAILTTAQRVLEECCFDFADRRFPNVLRKQGWDCALAVELTKWDKILARGISQLPSDSTTLSVFSIKDLLAPTRQLRHTAVHRLPATASGVREMLRAALRLTEALQDHTRAAQLQELISDVDEKIKTMELTKNVLEGRTPNQREEIRRGREDLDRREK
ncbi:hypothetical protein LX36DRAFT_722330 [Colletotrichum falcatum]|nr:hypothetical protein LX36DRAFT_722330 [Colletotrichum falcatum]